MSNPTYTKAIELLNLARVAPYTEARAIVMQAQEVLDCSERALLALRRLATGLTYGADMATSLVVCIEDAISLLTSKKSVEWAYPSSPNAQRFGYVSGCYVVNVRDGLTSKTVAGFVSASEALAFAAQLDGAWDPMFLRFASPTVARLMREAGIVA